jgi:hypothetical protein
MKLVSDASKRKRLFLLRLFKTNQINITMKIKLFFLLSSVLFVISTHAQIDLIGEYESSESNMVLVDDNLLKIFSADYDQGSFSLYNMDNSLYRQIDIPQAGITGNYFVYFVSRSLFDCDTSTVEYLVYHSEMSPMLSVDNRWVRIYREDGTELFYIDEAIIYGHAPSYATASTGWIQNGSAGAVMKIGIVNFTNAIPHTHKYFQLCGSVPVMDRSASLGELSGIWEEGFGNDSGVVVYPNPSNSGTIQFQLDENLNQINGVIRLFNMTGQLILEDQVNSSESVQTVDVSGLSNGTYLLNIQLEDGSIISEKLVKL